MHVFEFRDCSIKAPPKYMGGAGEEGGSLMEVAAQDEYVLMFCRYVFGGLGLAAPERKRPLNMLIMLNPQFRNPHHGRCLLR